MKIGVFAPPWGPTALPDDFAAVADAAERLGYPSLWVGDHVVFPRRVGSTYLYNESGVSPFDPEQPLLDPITLLAWLAARTTRVTLGISVLVLPMRSPVETAKLLADVAVLSGGRLQVGIGIGWLREEFAALGADFEHRGPITDEWIAILRHLWEGRAGPFYGEFHRFEPLGFQPTPGRLPIIVGGNSDAALARAARNDGWHAIRMEPDELAPRVQQVREMVAERGGEPAGFRIVYRGSLLPPDMNREGPGAAWREAAKAVTALLDAYRQTGVDELIVEFPEASTIARIEWMEWLMALESSGY